MTTLDTGENLVGRLLGGTYRIERLLGKGGMGAVYEASHSRLRRRFAVKVLFSQIAVHEEVLQRFQREALITSEIGHPNIVEVIDFNHDDGIPYLVMELLSGQDLEAVVRRAGSLPIERALDIALQIAAALRAAHQCGVIHRDLKPSNVFVCPRHDGGDLVKVVDFGISKVLGSTTKLTGTKMMMGTPGYMAPEQAKGHSANVKEQTDIFALGVILYEMLAGRQPFFGDTVPAVLYNIVYEPHRPLVELRADIPDVVINTLEIALAKNAEDRFASMEAFACALRGEPNASPERQRGPEPLSGEGRLVLSADAAVAASAGGVEPAPTAMARPVASGPAVDTPVVSPSAAPAAETTLGRSVGEVSAIELPPRRFNGVLIAAGAIVVAAGITAGVLFGGNESETGSRRRATSGRTRPAGTTVAPLAPPQVPATRTPAALPKARQPRAVVLRVNAAAKLGRVRCFVTPDGEQPRSAKAPCRFELVTGTSATLEIERRGYRRLKKKLVVEKNTTYEVLRQGRRLRLVSVVAEGSERDPQANAPRPTGTSVSKKRPDRATEVGASSRIDRREAKPPPKSVGGDHPPRIRSSPPRPERRRPKANPPVKKTKRVPAGAGGWEVYP